MLGSLELRNSEGQVLSGILRQPKRLALLAYLALAKPRGFHRRDTLLALFWPELDSSHAHAALRKTLHVLRQAMGADVLLNRGDEELSLDSQLFTCDAWTFEGAAEEGRLRDAMELYRGKLLEGFHVSGASPDLDRWLDGEQRRLAKLAAEAAWTISADEESAGDPKAAVNWGQRAFDMALPDEPMLRRLLVLLDRDGDHAGALRAYERFAAYLSTEFEAEPAPESRALIEAIRDRTTISPDHLDSLTRRPDPRLESSPQVSKSRAAEHPEPRQEPIPVAAHSRWRGPLILVAFFAVASLIPVLLALRADDRPALDPNRVAVAPFRVFDPALEVWGEGVVDYLARSLDKAGAIRTLSPTAAVRAWEGRSDVASAGAMGRRTGSGLVVFGTLMGLGADSLRVNATVYDVAEEEVIGDIDIRGSADRVDGVVDSLTVEVLRHLRTARENVALAHASIGSRSMPALKAFLQGEQAFRNAAWDTARAFFARATELDTAFALAYSKLGATVLYSELGRDGWQHVLRAGELNHNLSRRDSLLVEVGAEVAAIVTGKVPPEEVKERAELAYATALYAAKEYPQDAGAWYTLGAVREHLYDNLGTTTAQMAEAYQRSLELDSAYAPAYRPTLRYVMDEGDIESARAYARQYLSLNPPDRVIGLPLLLDRLLDPEVEAADADRLLDSLPTEPLFLGWIRLWLLTDSTELAIRVARASAAREHDPRFWFTADRIVQRNLAAELAYRGHLREAFQIAGTEDSGWFQMLPPELAALGAVPEAAADSAFQVWLEEEPMEPRGVKYVLWWWAARADTGSIARYMVRREDPTNVEALAALALARGDTAGALEQFADWTPHWDADPYSVIIKSRLLAASGRVEEASAELERPFLQDWPLTSRVVWRLERARLSERLGRSEDARRDYRFVSEVWRYADPELKPYVEEAKAALERLGA